MNANKNRIVIKVGTSTITNELGNNDLRNMDILARVLSDLNNKGFEVILVTSGAIAVGKNKMNLAKDGCAASVRIKQAAAAVGQCSIMFLYDKFFTEYGKTVAQILLTAKDIEDREKKENLVNTFNTLLEMGIIPIVNENDSVNFEEIESKDKTFGDNDMLSAVVAVLCEADRLIILSDIDGLYDKDPRKFPEAKLIEVVENITGELLENAGGAGSKRGTGGMKTKLNAAALAMDNGIECSIINGKCPDNIYKIVNGEKAGTLFKRF